ncbi:hypothetical protein EYF80_014754 [Liparis tanakae]|uniref:Uncharacterized protein n=1 Tax=Liparis tanakae TaxID=230148 RepID=A0A4Z2IAI8_9TELE|nr:hypothetical protein EYF80_014754 [Liparis tanakae]
MKVFRIRELGTKPLSAVWCQRMFGKASFLEPLCPHRCSALEEDQTSTDVSKQHICQSGCAARSGCRHIVGAAGFNRVKGDAPDTCKRNNNNNTTLNIHCIQNKVTSEKKGPTLMRVLAHTGSKIAPQQSADRRLYKLVLLHFPQGGINHTFNPPQHNTMIRTLPHVLTVLTAGVKRRDKYEENTQSCRHDEETTDVKNKVVKPDSRGIPALHCNESRRPNVSGKDGGWFF